MWRIFSIPSLPSLSPCVLYQWLIDVQRIKVLYLSAWVIWMGVLLGRASCLLPIWDWDGNKFVQVYVCFPLSVFLFGCVFLFWVLMCVCSLFTVTVVCWSPSQPLPYGTNSELIDRSSGRPETTSHSTHRESKATTPRVTSCTYLLLGDQGLDTH